MQARAGRDADGLLSQCTPQRGRIAAADQAASVFTGRVQPASTKMEDV